MLLQAFFTALTVAWGAISLTRRHHTIAAASFTMAVVTGTAAVADHTAFLPWIEGGYGMHLVALLGGYTLATAVAAWRSGRRAPRAAAVVGLLILSAITGGLYWQALHVVDQAVRFASPEDAAIIIAASRGEAVRLIEYAAALGSVAAALLIARPRRRDLVFSEAPSRAAA